MRKPLTKTLLDETLKALSRETHGEGSVYLTGGASAVVEGGREATLDIDLKIDPKMDLKIDPTIAPLHGMGRSRVVGRTL